MKKLMLTLLVIAGVILIYHAAMAAPQSVTIETQDQKLVRDTIVVLMLEDKFAMTQSDEYRLVFEKKMDSFWAMMWYGSGWNITPMGRFTFNTVTCRLSIRRINIYNQFFPSNWVINNI